MSTIERLKTRLIHSKVFLRFCVVGCINTGIDFGIFLLLHYHFKTPVLIANCLSFSMATANSYCMNRYWTFQHRARQKHGPQLARFLLVVLGGLLISSIGIYILSHYIPAYLAKILVIGVTLLWNYSGSTFFVFTD